MDRQPYLKSELIEMRPLRAGDFPALYAIAKDPLVWEQHPSKDRIEEEIYRRVFDETLASGGALAVIDRRSDSVIGTSRFDHFAPDRSEIEIGWTMLARSHWGDIYNGEMKRLMIEHASRSVRYIAFRVHSLNLRSQRAVEKLGALRVGLETDTRDRGENYVYRLDLEKYFRSS